jgi:restriction endonuclease Mrr
MTSEESWRKYLEAGAAVGQATAARAEDIAKRLFDPDEEERQSAWRDLEQLRRFGRLMGEQLAEMARTELGRKLKSLGEGPVDQFFERIADLLDGSSSPTVPTQDRGDSVLEAKVVVVTTPEAAGVEQPKAKKHKKKATAEKTKLKHKKKEKDGKRHARGPERVMTLAPPPDPSGRT